MKTILVLLSLFCSCLYGQTPVAGGNVSGIWTSAGSPYNVSGSIMVAAGSTLVIQPGVTLNFTGHYKFLIKGTLVAVGAPGNFITFTAANATTGWYGLRIDAPAATQDSTLLKYCRIERGIANGTGDDKMGGGVFIKSFSKVSVNSCTITNNKADADGGGMYCENSNIILANNTISNNASASTSYNGGGGVKVKDCSLSIIGNKILNNTSEDVGAGINAVVTVTGIAVSIISNTISNNTVIGMAFGGGIYCAAQCTITNNRITGNSTPWNGGGLYCYFTSPLVSDNHFEGNSAGNGGAMNLFQGKPYVINNTIVNNSSQNSGGAIVTALVASGSPTFVNNVIANNSTGGDGGAVFTYSSSPVLINNTIVNNKAVKGGGLYCDYISNPKIKNCIFFGNAATTSGPQVHLQDEQSDPDFTFCDVDGGQAGFELNGNFFTGQYISCINQGPLFVAPSATTGTFSGSQSNDWSLQALSPCIDTGDPIGPYVAADILGNIRVINVIDIGAYESGSMPTGIAAQQRSQAGLILFPNPFTHSATLKFGQASAGVLQVYNAVGQLVQHYEIEQAEQVRIDRGELEAGIYFFKWNSADGSASTGKMIVD